MRTRGAPQVRQDLSSYEPALSESHSSPSVSGTSSEFKGGLGAAVVKRGARGRKSGG